jgi:hypothetical protein
MRLIFLTFMTLQTSLNVLSFLLSLLDTTRHGDDEDEKNAEILSSQSRTAMGESAIKSVGDAASKIILDEESGKDKGHRKPGMEAVMVDISDVVMSNTEYKADIINAAMLKTEAGIQAPVHYSRGIGA